MDIPSVSSILLYTLADAQFSVTERRELVSKGYAPLNSDHYMNNFRKELAYKFDSAKNGVFNLSQGEMVFNQLTIVSSILRDMSALAIKVTGTVNADTRDYVNTQFTSYKDLLVGMLGNGSFLNTTNISRLIAEEAGYNFSDIEGSIEGLNVGSEQAAAMALEQLGDNIELVSSDQARVSTVEATLAADLTASSSVVNNFYLHAADYITDSFLATVFALDIQGSLLQTNINLFLDEENLQLARVVEDLPPMLE